jgi:hypothetical protein
MHVYMEHAKTGIRKFRDYFGASFTIWCALLGVYILYKCSFRYYVHLIVTVIHLLQIKEFVAVKSIMLHETLCSQYFLRVYYFQNVHVYVNESLMLMSCLPMCLYISYMNLLNGYRRNFVLVVRTKYQSNWDSTFHGCQAKFLYGGYFDNY